MPFRHFSTDEIKPPSNQRVQSISNEFALRGYPAGSTQANRNNTNLNIIAANNPPAKYRNSSDENILGLSMRRRATKLIHSLPNSPTVPRSFPNSPETSVNSTASMERRSFMPHTEQHATSTSNPVAELEAALSLTRKLLTIERSKTKQLVKELGATQVFTSKSCEPIDGHPDVCEKLGALQDAVRGPVEKLKEDRALTLRLQDSDSEEDELKTELDNLRRVYFDIVEGNSSITGNTTAAMDTPPPSATFPTSLSCSSTPARSTAPTTPPEIRPPAPPSSATSSSRPGSQNFTSTTSLAGVSKIPQRSSQANQPLPCHPQTASSTSITSTRRRSQTFSILNRTVPSSRDSYQELNNGGGAASAAGTAAECINGWCEADADDLDETRSGTGRFSYLSGCDEEPTAAAFRPVSVAQANRHSAIIGDHLFSLQVMTPMMEAAVAKIGNEQIEEDFHETDAANYVSPLTPPDSGDNVLCRVPSAVSDTQRANPRTTSAIPSEDAPTMSCRVGRTFNNPLGGGYVKRKFVGNNNQPIVGRSSVAAYHAYRT